jgi:lipid II:glycine glycyltransferase (peptidoglycan interpeptide bridge formation enzyme)
MEWLNFLEKAFHLEKLPMGLYQDGSMVGLFPMLMTRKGPFRILGSPLTGWNTPYMGPLIKAELLNEAMSAFNSFIKSLKADYVEVRFPQADLILPSMARFHNEPVYTYIVDLEGGEDKVWSRLKGECRRDVRKALKNNVKIVETEERSWVEDFFPMLQNSFAKTGQVPTRIKESYYDLWDYLNPTGKLKVIFAEYEGHRIAGLAFLTYRDTVYAHAAGAYGKYNRVAPTYLMYWHMIKWAAANGFRKFDFTGKGIKSIDHFKESFGPDVAARTLFTRANGLTARVGRAVYGKLEPAVRTFRYRVNKLGGNQKEL